MCNLKSVKGLLALTLIPWIIFIQESEDKKYNVRQVSHKSSLTCIGKGWQSQLKTFQVSYFPIETVWRTIITQITSLQTYVYGRDRGKFILVRNQN